MMQMQRRMETPQSLILGMHPCRGQVLVRRARLFGTYTMPAKQPPLGARDYFVLMYNPTSQRRRSQL